MLDEEQREFELARAQLEKQWALEDAIHEVLYYGDHFQPEALTFDQLKGYFPYGTHSWQQIRTSRKGNQIVFGVIEMRDERWGGLSGSIEFTSIVATISSGGSVLNYATLHSDGLWW